MIRKAEEKDIADLVEYTLSFCRTTPISSLVDVSVEKLTDIYLEMIIDKKGVCYVFRDKEGNLTGFIAGCLGELPFTKDKSGIVLCWWAKKDKSFHLVAGVLFDTFQDDCKSQGVKNIIVAAIGPKYSRSIETFYNKENYTPYETVYIKDLR